MQPTRLTRRSLIVGLAGAGAATGVLAADPGVSASELAIGQTITLQGGRNAYGSAVLEGVRLFFASINAAGGVAGRRLVLRTLDDDNNTATAAANARRLAQEGAFLLFGPIEGGPSTAVADVAAELGVPLFGPMAGSPTLRRPHAPMVFPVRAEHREEFRALMSWGQRIGLRSAAFFHADSAVGRLHLTNVQLLADELGLKVVLALPFKGDVDDARLDDDAARLRGQGADLVLNHGSPGIYARLIQRARAAGVGATFMAVNSGSSQLAASLGPLARGMVFAQVVPSPWERKHALTREFRAAAEAARPAVEPSYGALEGFMTAKALVMVLREAGRELTRAGFIRAAYRAPFDLGGVRAQWAPGLHEGSHFVDLAIVARDGRWIH